MSAQFNALLQVTFDFCRIRGRELPADPLTGYSARELVQVKRNLQTLLTRYRTISFDLLLQGSFGRYGRVLR